MIEVNTELYKIFYTVANFKSITKAAKYLYISQPAVTMSIKKLEGQLGITLFVRTKKGVTLTSEGSILYDYIQRAMENIKIGENRVNNLKKLESGNIRIGIGTTLTKYFLSKYLKTFHEKYPKITIDISTDQTKKTISNLENGLIDVAIITSDNTDIKGLNTKYTKEIQDIFIANKDYSYIKDTVIELNDLNNYPLLLQGQNTSTRNFLDKFTEKNNVTLSPVMKVDSYSLVIEFAKIGMGIGFITREYIEKELNSGELIEIKTIPKAPKRKILVLTKKDYLPSFSVQKLIDIIKKDQ